MDHGHELTEQMLGELEDRIAREYAKALRDMKRKTAEYFKNFEEDDKRWKGAVAAGERTEEDYKKWRFKNTMIGKRWTQMRDSLARDLEKAKETALKIAGEAMPDVFALNGNFATYQIEHDAGIDTSFTLYNHDTAEFLLEDNRQLMPGPSTKKAKEIAANEALQWDKDKIQSAVLQGVMQGETPQQIADRLMGVGQMDYNSAIRYARTMTTNAQNAGRYEAIHRAASVGVDLVIEWEAVLDNRTRHSHRMMHGQRREVDEPFEIVEEDGTVFEIYYPGDSSGRSDAPQGEIWNCRCTLLSWVKGFEGETVKKAPGLEDMTFEEWQQGGTRSGNNRDG